MSSTGAIVASQQIGNCVGEECTHLPISTNSIILIALGILIIIPLVKRFTCQDINEVKE